VASKKRWDPEKSEANWRKHGVSFEEAETVFGDPEWIWREDDLHSDDEDRYLVIGTSISGRLLVVVYCIRDDDYRLIHARAAGPSERRQYMKGNRIHDKADEAINYDDIPEIKDFSGFKRGGGPDIEFRRDIIRVSIEPDVARHYADSDSVNAALRILIAEGRAPEPRNE
jgi:uncharacterized protein